MCRLSPVVTSGLLIAVASLIAEHGLEGTQASVVAAQCLWDLPRPGIELICSALAGGFSTTGPSGKPWELVRNESFWASQVALVVKKLPTNAGEMKALKPHSDSWNQKLWE